METGGNPEILWEGIRGTMENLTTGPEVLGSFIIGIIGNIIC